MGCTEGKIQDTLSSCDMVLVKSSSILSPVGVASLTCSITGGTQILSNSAVTAIKLTDRNDATGLV